MIRVHSFVVYMYMMHFNNLRLLSGSMLAVSPMEKNLDEKRPDKTE